MNESAANSRSSSSVRSFWIATLLALFAVMAARYLMGCQQPLASDQGPNHPAVGRSLPSLELQGLDGQPEAIQLSDLRGKVVLINFWGTWCPPCREELPHLAALNQEFNSREDFQMLAVSCLPDASSEQFQPLKKMTEEFLQKANLDLPAFTDVGGTTRLGVDMALNGFNSYPTTLVLDGDHTIQGVWIGYRRGVTNEMGEVIRQSLDANSRPASTSDEAL